MTTRRRVGLSLELLIDGMSCSPTPDEQIQTHYGRTTSIHRTDLEQVYIKLKALYHILTLSTVAKSIGNTHTYHTFTH